MIEKGADGWNYGLCGACESGNLNIVKLMIFQQFSMLNKILNNFLFSFFFAFIY